MYAYSILEKHKTSNLLSGSLRVLRFLKISYFLLTKVHCYALNKNPRKSITRTIQTHAFQCKAFQTCRHCSVLRLQASLCRQKLLFQLNANEVQVNWKYKKTVKVQVLHKTCQYLRKLFKELKEPFLISLIFFRL